MIRISITTDAADARAFLVRIEGEIRNPKSLNDALGRRLARELQGHFRARNTEPNRLGGVKTNFWKDVADATVMTEATETGATVTIAEAHYRIHLFGGTIKPTGGRKWLTIPLVREAHGRRVREYEKQTGRKLFRLPGRKVLMERTGHGSDSFLAANSTDTIRGKNGYRKVGIGGGSTLRAVYALAGSARIKQDPRALPTQEQLLSALNDTAGKWAARLTRKGTST